MGDRAAVPRGLAAFVRDDGASWAPERLDEVLGYYFASRGSLPRTARRLGVPYGTLHRWIAEHEEVREALRRVDEILQDRAHQLYLDRVYDPEQKNPAWAIFWLKKNIPRYFEAGERKLVHRLEVVVRDGALALPAARPALLEATPGAEDGANADA